jgi:integrase/recombinase XerD
MPLKKGFAAVTYMRRWKRENCGGNKPQPLGFARDQPDALAIWAEEWLESLRARNYAEGSLHVALDGLKTFMQWAQERDVTRAGEVTRPMLETYQRWMSRCESRSGKRLSWSTQSHRIAALRQWFRWLARQNVIVHNPASELELPRQEKRLPVAGLSGEEVARLMAVPDVSDPLGLRNRSILELFYATGLRRAELCHLECSDVNPERGTVTIRLGKGRKDRVVPLGAGAGRWIERYLREVRPRLVVQTAEPALFLTGMGGPFSPDVLSRQVAKWLKQAGLGQRGSCHLLRHTCATHMLEGGADIRFIQQLLGHENLETTALYTEVTIRQLIEVHTRCHPSAQSEKAASVVSE